MFPSTPPERVLFFFCSVSIPPPYTAASICPTPTVSGAFVSGAESVVAARHTGYSGLIQKNPLDLPATHLVGHSIDTGDAPPTPERRLRLSPEQDALILTEIRDMLAKGIIEPSYGRCGFPVVLVKKKDRSFRFRLDFRRLNAVTKRDEYPIHRIDETLQQVGATWFTTLDMCAGYWQVPIRERVRDKVAFTSTDGLFKFIRMPFGLCHNSLTFQWMMDSELRGVS